MDDVPGKTAPFAAEAFAGWAAALDVGAIPGEARSAAAAALLDFAGLCVSARHEAYVLAAVESWDGAGPCTALGHAGPMDAAGAAFVNGTAAHGEDYDDTFEGTPVHTGAVIMPAVLAACERQGRSGADALAGMVVGAELMCRMALVTPTAVHRAGFHPTAVIGAMGAAAGIGRALGQDAGVITNALGVAGSMASGIIEYLAEGTWTKRIHPGWAAQCGLRAAALAGHGFLGPRTVFEGEHGFFFAFADHGITPDYSFLTDRLSDDFHMSRIAFKPYACGTMTQPFIDCAIRLGAEGVLPGDIAAIQCKVGEGTVHRLWEPLSEKRRPSTPYSAKFSVPFCISVGLVDGAAGLGQFTGEKIHHPAVLALAEKISYEIDPADGYPDNYSGHIRATLTDGSVREVEQPHMRGGVHEPLSRDELIVKFRSNIAYGGWAIERGEQLLNFCVTVEGHDDLKGLADFRGE